MGRRLIDADVLIDVIEREPWVHITDYNIAFYAVKHAPTVDAVPREIEQANKQAAYVRGYEDGQKDKYGRWVDAVPVVHGRWRHYEGMLICSECGGEFYDDIMEWCGDHVPKFCPECGADMREDSEHAKGTV